MDIDDIRRANIRLLQQSAGSARLAADKVGMTYAQFVNYRDGAKEAKTGKVRGMRKETAWRIEDAFNMPRGWLDQPHGSEASGVAELPPPAYVHPNATIRQIIALCEATDEAGAAWRYWLLRRRWNATGRPKQRPRDLHGGVAAAYYTSVIIHCQLSERHSHETRAIADDSR